MEYFRTEKGQIYADVAYRLGKIVMQYKKMSVDEEKFEATLYLTALQSLLTNYKEHIVEMIKKPYAKMNLEEKKKLSFFQKNIDGVWGLSNSCWIQNTFYEDWTLESFIDKLKSAASHPTNIDIENDYPSTGYITIKDDKSEKITKYQFVNSPDTRRNTQLWFTSKHLAKDYISRNKDTLPENIDSESFGEKYFLTLNSEPFIRIAIIELTVEQLYSFLINLANYLAQPVLKNWDGKTIKWLFAA